MVKEFAVMKKEFQRCTRCVMDNSSDSTIHFDLHGHCNYCTNALSRSGMVYFPNDDGKKRLQTLLEEIKGNGKRYKYDCIMGISGGLDSSYLLYLGYKWGLRILAIHVDDGFDTEISKSNLQKLVRATGFDYVVITPDTEQFNALTKAYMKASVPNLAVPQDNILFASIYSYMRKYKIKYFLSGGNFSLESILQKGNTYKALDVVNLKDINRRFGSSSIDKLEFLSTLRLLWDNKIIKIQTPRPLDLIDYRRNNALQELNAFCGFEYYGRKHLENILTAFIQLYWFPLKFGVDKRTSHLSSMIISKQITRVEALAELAKPLYDEKQMLGYIQVIKQKIDISDSEFDKIMAAPTAQHNIFKTENDTLLFKLLKGLSLFMPRKWKHLS